ncbi:MAG TPA: GNAT family N-acetyltransferase [Actinopolymorphaceae bacterium]
MADISGSTTIAATDHPYLRRHVDPVSVLGFWRHRSATVFAPVHEIGDDPGLVCLGDRDDLGVLLDLLSRTIPPPSRVSVTADATDALPAAWQVRDWTGWTAFSTESAPDVAGADAVTTLPLRRWATAISTFLDESSPQGWGRPERDDSQWWGVLDDAGTRLLAVGAVRTGGAPSAHLSGIATHPSARGRGLGSAVTAVLTRVGLAAGQPTVTLDAYSSNAPALRMYARLGYVVDARFRSGEVHTGIGEVRS